MLGQQHGHYLEIQEKMKELTEREILVDFTAADRVKDKILKELSEISIFLDENNSNQVSQIVQVKEDKISNISMGTSH